MKEVIEVLNDTSAERLIGYTIAALLLAGTILDGLARIVKHFRK